MEREEVKAKTTKTKKAAGNKEGRSQN